MYDDPRATNAQPVHIDIGFSNLEPNKNSTTYTIK